jgi:hypothetical protein
VPAWSFRPEKVNVIDEPSSMERANDQKPSTEMRMVVVIGKLPLKPKGHRRLQ